MASALAGNATESLAHFERAVFHSPDYARLTDEAEGAFRDAHGSSAGFEAWIERTRLAARSAVNERFQDGRRPLSDFRWVDLSGRPWDKSDLAGKTVLMNFWATWCAPCVHEMPHLQRLWEELKPEGRVLVLGVSLDSNPGLVLPFLERRGFDFPNLLAGDGEFATWAPAGIPRNLIIDPSGTVVAEMSGFGGDGDAWLGKLKALLEDASPAQ